MTQSTLDKIRKLNPITDLQVTDSLGADDRETTRKRALAMAATRPNEDSKSTPEPVATGIRTRRRVVRLALRTAAPVLVAAGVLSAVLIAKPDQPAGPSQVPVAVEFVPQGDFLVIKIVDPDADPARINKELADRGLNITITLPPGSPSTLGKNTGVVIEGGETIKQSTEPAGCLQSGSTPCVPVFKIPSDFKGKASLDIARPARDGQEYQVSGQVDAAGELLHGQTWRGKTVGEVKAMLAAHNGTIGKFRIPSGQQQEAWIGQADGTIKTVLVPGMKFAETAPDNWYVLDAQPLKPGQITVWAYPKRSYPNPSTQPR